MIMLCARNLLSIVLEECKQNILSHALECYYRLIYQLHRELLMRYQSTQVYESTINVLSNLTDGCVLMHQCSQSYE